ncbi:MAG: hypothetical protein ACFFC7_00410 [Candidatus Hermodarchaeota archaeon]
MTYKDIHVYPKIADKVIFWTLYGKPTRRFDDNPKITMISSDQLIKQLKEKITPETSGTIMPLIKK